MRRARLLTLSGLLVVAVAGCSSSPDSQAAATDGQTISAGDSLGQTIFVRSPEAQALTANAAASE